MSAECRNYRALLQRLTSLKVLQLRGTHSWSASGLRSLFGDSNLSGFQEVDMSFCDMFGDEALSALCLGLANFVAALNIWVYFRYVIGYVAAYAIVVAIVLRISSPVKRPAIIETNWSVLDWFWSATKCTTFVFIHQFYCDPTVRWLWAGQIDRVTSSGDRVTLSPTQLECIVKYLIATRLYPIPVELHRLAVKWSWIADSRKD